MKSIAKLVFFLIMMICIVTTCIEVIVLYMTRAEVVAMTSHVIQNTVELSAAGLADQEVDLAEIGAETTSIYSYGLVDVFKDELETYFADAGQPLTFVKESNLVFDGVTYDHALVFINSASLTNSTKIHNMTIYIQVNPQVNAALENTMVVHTLIDADTYFSSKLLRGTIGANKMAGPLIYHDTVTYTIVDWRN